MYFAYYTNSIWYTWTVSILNSTNKCICTYNLFSINNLVCTVLQLNKFTTDITLCTIELGL